MNRKKPNKIYNVKKQSEEIKPKKKINDNYIKRTQKNSDNNKNIIKKLKTEEIDYKTKSKYEDSVPTMQTMNSPQTSQLKNIKETSEINNEINKTPKKRKKSNSNKKNETEEDLVTSFERKPSELKSPETISEDSFTSSYEKEEKENNEIIFVDKIKEKQNIKTIIDLDNYDKNNKKNENLKIKVNISPRESINKNKPLIQEKKEKKENNDIKSDNNNNIDEKKNKNDKLLLTNIKNVKQKKFLIQTEDKKRRYIKKYVNFGKNNNIEINKSQTNINKENKNKKEIIINKSINNKLGLKVEEINNTNTKEININKNQNYTTLSRNISFHNNSKKLIYAPKKLVSSTILKSPKKQEIQPYKKISLESFIPLSENIKNISTSMKNSNKKINLNLDIKSNPEQIRKRIFELNNIFNKNQIIFDNNLKNNNNFFNENKSNFNFSNNSIRQRNSITNLYNDNEINKMKDARNMQMINLNLIGNKILGSNNINNNNLNNSTGEINNLNNIYLQNLFQYNFSQNKINDNSSLNCFLINFEDLIILQKDLQEMIFSLSKNKPIQNECFEFWNYYYNSSIFTQFEKIFLNEADLTEVKLSIYYSLMSIMLCYDYSFETDIFIKAIVSLMDILKMNYKNLILICEYILKKISKDCLTNIWVLKLSAIVNESNYNDFTSQLLKGYNMTIIEKISYNTNIILQNLRYLLKNFKSKKNGILTGIFKKIKEKTYEEINTFFRENIMRVSNINGSILGSIFLLKNRNFRPVPNPYVRTKNNKEYSLVIDLDETLIHFKPQNNGEDGGILRVRPGINKFLDEVGKYYELIVFTTATQDYADELIDAIEEDKIYFEHRFYREHATIIDNDFVKDLSRIGRPLDKIIIIDNMPQNFKLQKENGIIIKAFWGEDNSDTALIELIPILINIAKEGGDVRKGLVKYKDDIIRKVTSCFSKNEKV